MLLTGIEVGMEASIWRMGGESSSSTDCCRSHSPRPYLSDSFSLSIALRVCLRSHWLRFLDDFQYMPIVLQMGSNSRLPPKHFPSVAVAWEWRNPMRETIFSTSFDAISCRWISHPWIEAYTSQIYLFLSLFNRTRGRAQSFPSKSNQISQSLSTNRDHTLKC